MRSGFKVIWDSNSDTDLASGSHPYFPLCLSLTREVHSAKWAFLGVRWGLHKRGIFGQALLEEHLQDIEGPVGLLFLSLGRQRHADGSLSLGPSAVEAAVVFEHLEEMVQVPPGRAVGEAGGQHHSREPLGTGQVGWD